MTAPGQIGHTLEQRATRGRTGLLGRGGEARRLTIALRNAFMAGNQPLATPATGPS
jgi:hypothetical protein